jgi:hypothetical protein
MSGFEDVNRYETAVAMLKSAFLRELEELAIDFTAKLMKTSAQKEAKAVTLANARADAEMTDATKPVVDTIGEEIKRQVAAQRVSPPFLFPATTHANLSAPANSPHATRHAEEEHARPAYRVLFDSEESILVVLDEEARTEEQGPEAETEHQARTRSQGVKLELEGKIGRKTRKRKRRKAGGVVIEQEKREGEGNGGDAGQRLLVDATAVDPPSLDAISWVSHPDRRFHYHRPDSYPDLFFATSTSDYTRRKFVICTMSPLYYDTRIRNRAFHNLTDIVLTPEQTLLLALNPKFTPRPRPTKLEPALEAVDDFSRRLRLRVENDAKDKKADQKKKYTPVDKLLSGEYRERGQPRFVPRFHIPNPSAKGPALIEIIESALSNMRDRIELEVLSKQAVCIRPNIDHTELRALLQMLADNSVLAVPADKNPGLCLVLPSQIDRRFSACSIFRTTRPARNSGGNLHAMSK